MKKLFVIFLILLVGIGLGFLIHEDSGYVLVAYKQWIIATSFWVAVITLLIAFWLVYFLVRLFKNTAAIPRRMAFRGKILKERKNRKLMMAGLTELADGQFKKAEKRFISSLSKRHSPFIHYLFAAQAAQARQSLEKRDKYLRAAFECCGGEYRLAVSLTQVQLQIESKQWNQALATLQLLSVKHSKNPLVLAHLKTVYTHLQDWESLKTLLPLLKKYRVDTQPEHNALEKLTLGYLAYDEKLYGQAKSYAEQSIKYQSCPKAYALLARVHDALGENEEALACYRDAVSSH